MDLSQPVIVVIAFVAGFGFMFCTRMVWGLLSYSLHFAVIIGAIALLGQNGILRLDDLSGSAAGRAVQSSLQFVGAATGGIKEWISEHEIKVHIARKHSALPQPEQEER